MNLTGIPIFDILQSLGKSIGVRSLPNTSINREGTWGNSRSSFKISISHDIHGFFTTLLPKLYICKKVSKQVSRWCYSWYFLKGNEPHMEHELNVLMPHKARLREHAYIKELLIRDLCCNSSSIDIIIYNCMILLMLVLLLALPSWWILCLCCNLNNNSRSLKFN